MMNKLPKKSQHYLGTARERSLGFDFSDALSAVVFSLGFIGAKKMFFRTLSEDQEYAEATGSRSPYTRFYVNQLNPKPICMRFFEDAPLARILVYLQQYRDYVLNKRVEEIIRVLILQVEQIVKCSQEHSSVKRVIAGKETPSLLAGRLQIFMDVIDNHSIELFCLVEVQQANHLKHGKPLRFDAHKFFDMVSVESSEEHSLGYNGWCEKLVEQKTPADACQYLIASFNRELKKRTDPLKEIYKQAHNKLYEEKVRVQYEYQQQCLRDGIDPLKAIDKTHTDDEDYNKLMIPKRKEEFRFSSRTNTEPKPVFKFGQPSQRLSSASTSHSSPSL